MQTRKTRHDPLSKPSTTQDHKSKLESKWRGHYSWLLANRLYSLTNKDLDGLSCRVREAVSAKIHTGELGKRLTLMSMLRQGSIPLFRKLKPGPISFPATRSRSRFRNSLPSVPKPDFPTSEN